MKSASYSRRFWYPLGFRPLRGGLRRAGNFPIPWFGFQATLRAVQHTGKLEFDRLPLVSGGLEGTNNYFEAKLIFLLGGHALYRENNNLTSVSKWRL